MSILSKNALTTHHHYCTALHIILWCAFEVQLDVAKTLRRTTSSPYWLFDGKKIAKDFGKFEKTWFR